jgi:hypothetical protein
MDESWTPLERLLDDITATLMTQCDEGERRIRELEQGIRRHRYSMRSMAVQHMDERGRVDDIGLRMLDEACRDLWMLTNEGQVMARDEGQPIDVDQLALRAIKIVREIARRYGLNELQHPQLSELMGIIRELRMRCRDTEG